MKTISSVFLMAGLLLFSQTAWSQPVAVNDNFSPIIQQGETIYFNLVQNDYDPDGMAFKICDVIALINNSTSNQFNDTSMWILTLHGIVTTLWQK